MGYKRDRSGHTSRSSCGTCKCNHVAGGPRPVGVERFGVKMGCAAHETRSHLQHALVVCT